MPAIVADSRAGGLHMVERPQKMIYKTIPLKITK